MDLRAFYKTYTTYSAHIYAFLTIYIVLNVSAFGTSFVAYQKVPSEIRFADVTFQFNDATRVIFLKEIESLQVKVDSKQHDLKYLSALLPEISNLLAREAMPDDFKFLLKYRNYQSSIEQSNLLGSGVYWCMDKGKAEKMGLLVNYDVDERRHLYKATESAITCLHRNQVLLHNWGSTLFAHLAGEDVLQALRISQQWGEERFLLLDSPAYASVVQFLAYKWYMEQELQFLNPDESYFAYRFTQSYGKTLGDIAASLRVDLDQLAESNQWITKDNVIEKGYDVVVIAPESRFYEITELASLSSLKGASVLELGFPVLSKAPDLEGGRGGVFFKINGKKGIKAAVCDNFVTLAYKAQIDPADFLKYNELDDRTALQVGRVYYIESKSKKGPIAFHTVLPHQSIWEISHLYGVQLKEILKLNRLEEAYRLQEGRVVHLQNKIGKTEPIRYEDLYEAEYQKEIEEVVPDFVELQDHPKVTLESEKVTSPIDSLQDEEIENVTYVKESAEIASVEAELKVVKREDDGLLYSENLKNQITSKRGEYIVHEVKKGETLFEISQKYDIPVKEIFKMNRLTSSIIPVGDTIKVKKI